jgi:hypothetical protein
MSKLPYVHKSWIDPKAVKEALGNLIGETVCVAWVKDKEIGRLNFEPQISVQAELEGSAVTGKYRVIIDDNTYSYFYDDTVSMVGQDVGKRAVIYID